MALKPCKECGKEISTKAEKCPHCGTPTPGTSGIGIGGILKWAFVAFTLYVVIQCSMIASKVDKEMKEDGTAPAAAAIPQTPALEVQSWKCEKERSYFHVRGEVKNISDRKLDNVAAVGIARTKDGTLVVSEDSLIDYNPIMPGQTSPFDVMILENPLIDNCELEFKKLLGGTIAHRLK